MIDEMFEEFEFNERPQDLIVEVNKVKLPNDYLDFMKKHNGGEGNVGENSYVSLFRLEELTAINEEYEAGKYWSDFVVLGSDGGSMLLGYNSAKNIYCAVDSCSIDEEDVFCKGKTLEEFFRKMDKEFI